MKKALFLLLSLSILSCSSERRQMETIRDLAKENIITFLKLPEGTTIADKSISITEKPAEIGEIGATYVVKVAVISKDNDGNKKTETHTLEYIKIGEKGLSEADYELKSFD